MRRRNEALANARASAWEPQRLPRRGTRSQNQAEARPLGRALMRRRNEALANEPVSKL